MDEFEQFLKQQPVRQVPTVWRREILAAASTPAERAAGWRRWLWPSPIAWAAVAGVWLVIIGLGIAARPSENQTAREEPATAHDIAVAFAERRQLLIELTGPITPPARRQSDPGPHSELIRYPLESGDA